MHAGYTGSRSAIFLFQPHGTLEELSKSDEKEKLQYRANKWTEELGQEIVPITDSKPAYLSYLIVTYKYPTNEFITFSYTC